MALGDVISEVITTLAEPPIEDGWAPAAVAVVAVVDAALMALLGRRWMRERGERRPRANDGPTWSRRQDWTAPVFLALLVAGLAGMWGPSWWVLPGTLLLCALLGPLSYMLSVALVRRGPLPPTGPFGARRRLAVVAASVAAPVAALGLVAVATHNSGAYAMRYGERAMLGLPGQCSIDGATAVCPSGRVVDRPGPDEYVNDEYKSFYLHFSETTWSEYKQYYSVTGLGSSSANNVEFEARIVEEDAYATPGLSTSPLAPLGREPLPWLAWVTLPALLIPWSLSRRARARIRIAAA
ncbi:hypothetical protein ACI2L1_44740 [Streptomyces sp. NPDC019531]|uniref:hypothetical protein n=1 Tax=Streptomyces sp. NPDC019531 TaxID=3365062 RepID=UPI00384DCD8E